MKYNKRFMKVYEDSFSCILKRAQDHYDREQDIPAANVLFRLMDFESTHGREAVIDLWGFFNWALDRDKEQRIWPTISHDLNGANDELMSPRTEGYARHIWGEDYKDYPWA